MLTQKPLIQRVSDVIFSIESSKGDMEFMKTGFSTLDEKLDGGFLRKELVVIGGATGIGKSYLASQLLLNIASQGFKSAYFSLEISNEMIVSRMLGTISNIKPTRIRMGMLTSEEFENKTKAKVKLESLGDFLFFYDQTYQLSDIEDEIKKHTFEFVVIDFIQNIFTEGTDEYSRLSKAALELQKTAKENNCTILVLSQLSNMVAREGNSSKVIEYRGSGSIAMVCDLGFFIEREASVSPDGYHVDLLNLNLKKNRRGISGISFQLAFRHPGGWIYEA
ncbi:MAG: Replicative DNA helicase [Microgenomates group bacterium GW2011_GWB1_40_9]|nr:MAG: Replicative DNA helicase [Microgenomates group bacterium GW2011_GWB1_40_9]